MKSYIIKTTISKLASILILLLVFSNLIAQTTRNEYISKYKNMAIREMNRTGIPASITMAQALLESDNGNSKLARRAKNHFGIKCGGSWNGKTFHQDDDAKHECFRKYKNIETSYHDHSEFLKKKRYAKLFNLSPTDYKGWARGLKKAGYATNPKYPSLLINIIESNNLQELDLGIQQKEEIAQKEKHKNKVSKTVKTKESEFEIKSKSHTVELRNRVKFIVVKNGDTFRSINKEFDLMGWQLAKYNEISKNSEISEGQILYLQPKRKKAEFGVNYHTVEAGETMYDISQLYAIKLNKLYNINLMAQGTQAKVGTKLNLRKKLRGNY